MRWGYNSDDVTAYTTNNIFESARASAVMIGMNGRSFFRLRVTGIKAKDGTYGVHLHAGECLPTSDPKNTGSPSYGAGPHYNVVWHSVTPPIDIPSPIPEKDVSKANEVWLDLDVDSDGDARSTATVSFIPEGKRSIVFHAAPTVASGSGVGTAGARLACLPFTINKTG
jgi:superoxide dismutase, Cu-Zn family